VSSSQDNLQSLYGDDYYRNRNFCDSSILPYVRKGKLFNLTWGSRVTGVDLRQGKGKRALDAGCGTGLNSIILHELGYDVTGADFSGFAVQNAAQEAEQAGIKIPFKQLDIDNDPIPGPYDLILCCEVIEHVRNPAAVIQKLYDALSPGGILILTTPNRLGLSHLLLDHDKTHINVHSPFYWNALLKRLPGVRSVCQPIMVWDQLFPFLKKSTRTWWSRLPILGFRLRLMAMKLP